MHCAYFSYVSHGYESLSLSQNIIVVKIIKSIQKIDSQIASLGVKVGTENPEIASLLCKAGTGNHSTNHSTNRIIAVTNVLPL